MKRAPRWGRAALAILALSVLEILGEGCTSAESKDTPWGADYFPNVSLVSQDGKSVRFYQDLIKDKKVLINFIYTDCSQACGLATARLVQVQKRLGARVGRDVFIYSITVDPEHDTPEVLRKYARTFHVGPGWLFLTGTREDIDAVRFKLGERSAKLSDGHNNEVRVGDGAEGRWMKLPLFDDLDAMVVEIGKWLGPDSFAGAPATTYADAPRLAAPAAGQNLFQNRCAACHTIGQGDFLGPDLKGVTARRDSAWLARYIAAPDQMLAQKDPIATQLSAKYRGVTMPNLGLQPVNVGILIGYLSARSAALEHEHKAHADEIR